MSDLIQATGRRKRAIARVKLTLGQGVITINKKPMDEYFPRPQLQAVVRQPFEATGSGARFDVSVKAIGGGMAPDWSMPGRRNDTEVISAGSASDPANAPSQTQRVARRRTLAARSAVSAAALKATATKIGRAAGRERV